MTRGAPSALSSRDRGRALLCTLGAASALAPLFLLLARLVSQRLSPEGDPAVMLSVERSPMVSCVTAAVFCAVMCAPALYALGKRERARGRLLDACFALGVASALLGAAIPPR